LQPDYDDIEDENRLKPFPSSRSQNKKDSKKYGELEKIVLNVTPESFLIKFANNLDHKIVLR